MFHISRGNPPYGGHVAVQEHYTLRGTGALHHLTAGTVPIP